jgi:hypothetical protein
MAGQISVSWISAEYNVYMYLYVNTSKFDGAVNPLTLTEAAHVHVLSKPSNSLNRELECILIVIICLWVTRYRPFVPFLVCHEGTCYGDVDRDGERQY